MRIVAILVGVVLAVVVAGENATTTTNTTTISPTTISDPTTITIPDPTTTADPTTTIYNPTTSDPTTTTIVDPKTPTILDNITTADPITTPTSNVVEVDDPLTPGPRLPRGTVYQIRPIDFGDSSSDSDPFTALDSIAGIDLAKLKSRPGEDTSSSNIKVINYDSEAVEASDAPKFILANDGDSDESELLEPHASKRDPIPSSSQPIPIHTEEGAEEPWDASYAFGYTLEDQARHEVSDPDGNIKGYYQYVDDEGYVRKVVYTAGAGKGFVVLNKEKVKGPHVHSRPHHKIPPRPPHPHPSQRPIKHRPNYPASSGLEEYDFPESSFRPIPPPSPPRQGWGSIASGGSSKGPSGGGRRPIYVVKIRKPTNKHGDDDGGGYFNKEGFPDSSEDLGHWDGDIGNGPVYPKYRPGSKGGYLPPKGSGHGHHGHGPHRPDGAYTFGYETETANRLEKSDNYGNVRGSYSYIDNEGVKRTVHYIAGATTGFQVLGSSPSSKRNVRIEAPPGYVVTRRNTPDPTTALPLSASSLDSILAPSTDNHISSSRTLATAESEYPGFGPNVIVYHIHPDSNSANLSPWWDALGLPRKPKRMRRIMRVHRKKPRKDEQEDDYRQDFAESEKETQIQQGPLNTDRNGEDTLRETSTQPPPPRRSSRRPLPVRDNFESSVPNGDGLSPSVESSSPSPPPSTTYLIRARPEQRDRPRPFRHSTKVNLDNIDMNTFFVRGRRPSHRAYTSKNLVNLGEDSSAEHDIRSNPILLGTSHEVLRGRRRHPVPNPILLKPSSERVSVRSRGARLDVAESNVYAVRSTPSGVEVDEVTPPTPDPVEVFASGNLHTGESSDGIRTSKSMQLSISSSTTRVPVSFSFNAVEIPGEKQGPALNSISLSSSSMVHNGGIAETFPTTTPTPGFSSTFSAYDPPQPTSSPARENTLTLTEKEFDHTGIMSSSTRLMQRLGGVAHRGDAN